MLLPVIMIILAGRNHMRDWQGSVWHGVHGGATKYLTTKDVGSPTNVVSGLFMFLILKVTCFVAHDLLAATCLLGTGCMGEQGSTDLYTAPCVLLGSKEEHSFHTACAALLLYTASTPRTLHCCCTQLSHIVHCAPQSGVGPRS